MLSGQPDQIQMQMWDKRKEIQHKIYKCVDMLYNSIIMRLKEVKQLALVGRWANFEEKLP